jgi:positive regulator of sigma E activity
MIEETGMVIGRRGDTVSVRLERDSNCAGCQSCHSEAGGTSIVATARDPLHVRPGDRVRLQDRTVDDPKLSSAKAGLLLFGLPLLCFFPGFFGGQYLGRLSGAGAPDMIGLAGGLLGFAIPLLVLYLRQRRRAAGGSRSLVVSAVIRAGAAAPPAVDGSTGLG